VQYKTLNEVVLTLVLLMEAILICLLIILDYFVRLNTLISKVLVVRISKNHYLNKENCWELEK